jgi:CRISPR-associated protein Csh1
MLDTLLKIGEWQSKGMTEWDPILEKPSVKYETNSGVSIKNYVIGIVFDLDENNVYPSQDLLKEYDEDQDPERFKSISILPGNNKAIYATVESGKINQLFKTFFGKQNNENVEHGELIEAIDKDFEQYQGENFYQLVKDLIPLRNIFLEIVWDEEKNKTDFKKILNTIDLGNNEKIVLVYTAIKSAKHGYASPFPIAWIENYISFLKDKFLGDSKAELIERDKLCYASGEIYDDVTKLDLSTRYSINKMFVNETKNYASLFDKNLFESNYQISLENQAKLDLASNYLLDNYKTRITDIDHVIIPQLKWSDNPDLDLILDKLKTSADLLFSFKALHEVTSDIEIDVEGIYWLNFIAFESDGNFFKTISIIKDVSKFHFENVIAVFEDINWEFREMKHAVDWDTATKNYGEVSFFNLNAIYGLIPIRKEKEKKNIALQLFKAILEQRKIEKTQLFEFFSELMLCHYYERYNSYTNIRKYGKNYFGLAIRDSVFKYLAFIQVLNKLNLINMEEQTQTTTAKEFAKEYENQIQDFFNKMSFNDQQKALFFLGRMLNSVVYLQKGKNKTVIDKINYNGMDRDDIVRLRIDLFEKAKQYNSTEKVVFDDSHFGQHFNFDKWNMNPQEAVFFILTGYSYGKVKKQESNNQTN